MEVVEILKMGLPGLVFLLSVLSFKLLSQEQRKKQPSPPILRTIRQFMYINILLAMLTVAAPFVETAYFPTSTAGVYSVEAKLSGTTLDAGKAAVCSNAKYGGRYILITDIRTSKMIQVYAMGILPCTNKEVIALNLEEASRLGWGQESESISVEVAAAEQGQMYILHNT